MKLFLTSALAGLLLAACPAGAEPKPVPVNEYKGMQEREDVFAFTKKPKVTKTGDKWVIAFTSKGNCDATVTVLDKDGKTIRHLACGVLGVNAPHPFQQGTLAQTIEWDGLKDDFRKADVTGCRVKVGLGLRAEFDKSMMYNPHYLKIVPLGPETCKVWAFPEDKESPWLVGAGPDGNVHVVAYMTGIETAGIVGRVFSKDGKYLRTFFPPPAKDAERAAGILGLGLGTTKWGDRVMVTDWLGPSGAYMKLGWRKRDQKGRRGEAAAMLSKLAGVELRPADLPPQIKLSDEYDMACKYPILTADRQRDELYVQMIYSFGGSRRFDGRTGKRDMTWFSDPKIPLDYEHCSVGPDGLIYARFYMGMSRSLVRLDREGRPAPFAKEHAVQIPGGNAWWTRLPAALQKGADALDCGNPWVGTHTGGLHVGPSGCIVASTPLADPAWVAKHGLMKHYELNPKTDHRGILGNRVVIFDRDGKILSPNALGAMPFRVHNATMDRDGNIYAALPGAMPDAQAKLDGADIGPDGVGGAPLPQGVGSLVKFRGRGGTYPLNAESALKVGFPGRPPVEIGGALWAYGGVTSGQYYQSCQCTQPTFDMDFHGRSWVPARHLYSVVVLDSNMNRIARLGRYGNPDDADPSCGRIHFACPASVAVSDAALYVADTDNRRIVRAAISYAVEEVVNLASN